MGLRCLEYNLEVFLLNICIDPLLMSSWERLEWLISTSGLKRGWFDELESVEPILVVAVAK